MSSHSHKAVLLICLTINVWLVSGFAFAVVPDPQDAIIYEVNLRAFSQAGGIDGVTARIDEIDALGVNVIWLMPIHPIGAINQVPPLGSPYSVKDYSQISNEYGTQQDFTDLIDAAHSRGISVMMDWVANHTAFDHPWTSSNPEWYSQDGAGNIISPPGTNWLDVADLNYGNQAMRSAMIDEITYWARDVGVDGFRFDAADFVPFDFWQEAIPAVRSEANQPLLILAEGARSDHYAAGFDMTFDWGFYNALKSVFDGSSATSLASAHATTLGSAPSGKSVLRFTTNHDENAFDATPIELYGGLDGSLAAYAATLAYGGSPLVYTGQEIGWDQNIPFFSKAPVDWNTGASTQAWYEQILDIYIDRSSLQRGTLEDSSDSNIVLVRRTLNGEEIIMAINTRNSISTANIPNDWQGMMFDQFTGVNFDLLPSLQLDPYEVLVLANTPIPISGDYNGDGIVDPADYTVWRDTYGTTGSNLVADGDKSLSVDSADYTLWTNNFGNTWPTQSASTVPEPDAIIVVILGITILTLSRRQLVVGTV